MKHRRPMERNRALFPLLLFFPILLLCAPRCPEPGGELGVLDTTPAAHAMDVAPEATITVVFDRPVRIDTLDRETFRVFGSGTGNAAGRFTAAQGGSAVIFTPDAPFSAGESVTVNLSHDIAGADGSRLRAAGYAFRFVIRSVPTAGIFTEIARVSNRNPQGGATRIYGAVAADLDGDRFLDLTTVNEGSGDLRVFLNRADGSGLFEDFLPPVPIGEEASPNRAADFDNDGITDLCVSATESNSVWVLLGAGDGTFSSVEEIPVGMKPHGIAVLDVDGDGDPDIVNTNNESDDLSLLRNDGRGNFSEPVFFDAGVIGEYGLDAGDMNNDGIFDLVVGARDRFEIPVLLGNGDGTFTPHPEIQDSGGQTWVVVLGDVDGDGNLDASTANSRTGNGAILLGDGTGALAPPSIMETGAHTVSTDLGDLDGDGDLDWILSCFGCNAWKFYENDGAGDFSFDMEISAPANPSCAVIYDADNDGDLDVTLTDEIADLLLLMVNDSDL